MPIWLSVHAGLLAIAVAPGGPSVAGLSPPERRMLDPMRERLLRPEVLLDALALRGDESVADVGAGPGFFTLRLARRLPRGRVIAIDVDGPALAVLQRRAAAAGLRNVETRQVGPEDPGLAPASMALAFLCQVDQYLPDRARYFRALRRALRPGGRLVLVNYRRFEALDRDAATAAGFHAVLAAVAPPGYFVLIGDR
ncbi:MAG TPA: class I SAM-dependent methyltransferase [Myxococcales bacterium]|nr:class I SAM-dependent methyltransferase [Myxococcales bacterium]